MTLATPRFVTGFTHAPAPQVLETVRMTGSALAIWERQEDTELADWLGDLVDRGLNSLQQVIRPDDAGRSLATHLAGIAPDPSPHRDALVGLVWQLAEALARVTPCPRLRLRLDIAEIQSCPRWHLDAVTARMICTLRGPGTEFGTIGKGEAPEAIHRMPTGCAALFRGVLWPGDELSGILHRSPPFAEGDPARVVLILDPATDEDDWE